MIANVPKASLQDHQETGEPALAEQANRCFHCLEPVPAYTACSATISGVPQQFCCHGCKAVAEFIDGRDLGEFYQRRTHSIANQPFIDSAAGSMISNDWTFLDQAPLNLDYVCLDQQGRRQFSVYLQGVYCSSCSWLINNTLAKMPGGITASMDIDAKRLLLQVADHAVKLSGVVSTIEKLGYTASPILLDATSQDLPGQFKQENRQSLQRIAVAGFGMMQVMTYAVAIYFGDSQGMEDTYRRFLSLLSMLVATLVVFYAGKPFFSNAYNDIKNRHLGMDVPIALAIGGAYLPSVYQTLWRAPLQLPGHIYFDSAVMFVFFLSVGRYIEMRARHRLTSAPSALTRMLPPYLKVWRRLDGVLAEVQVKPRDIQVGDRLHLFARQLLSFDGLVAAGTAMLDESIVSGESKAVSKGPGDRLLAGSVIISGSIEAVASATWADSSIAKIERLLHRAKAATGEQAAVLQGIARYFVTAVLMLTLLVGVFWWFVVPARVFDIVLAMLVASCPCAFSLAAPIGATAASYALRAKGLLLANFTALRVLPQVTTWCFDKTGTITSGKPAITAVECYDSLAAGNCLQIAAALEQHSEHVLSAAFKDVDIDAEVTVTNVIETPGCGLAAKLGGRRYFLGKPAWVLQQITPGYAASSVISKDLEQRGWASVVGLADENGYLATFFIEDRLRPQAEAAINSLRAYARKIIILSGDRLSAVRKAAGHLQVDGLEGDLLPEQKMQRVRTLQAQGDVVAMLGDGINDAPVIGQADVSIAMSSGSEVSHSQADVIVLSGQLASLSTLHQVALTTQRITRQNLAWALLYNATVLPMAAAGLLTPWLAALGMSASSLLVVLNAFRISK